MGTDFASWLERELERRGSSKPIVVETAGEALDRLCRENGRAKWWVAAQVGIHPSHLSKVISGEKRMTDRVAAKLAELFNVPASTFLDSEATE